MTTTGRCAAEFYDNDYDNDNVNDNDNANNTMPITQRQ